MKHLKLRHCLIAWLAFGLGYILLALDRIADPDFWWHIATGKLIVLTRQVPTADPFSFTSFGQPWVTHEWLSELILYGVFARFGLHGVIAFSALMMSVLFIGIYHLAHRKIDSSPIALLIAVICGFTAFQFRSPRPQLFTYLLLILLILMLDRPVRHWVLWLIIPLFSLWANLHGAWVFGYLVLAVVLIERAIEALRGRALIDALKAATVLIGSFGAVFIGPSPLDRLTYSIQYVNREIPVRLIHEFQSPDFGNKLTLPYEILVLGLAPLIYFGKRHLRISEWMILLITLHLSLFSVRHVPLFGIVVAPVVALQTDGIIRRCAVRRRRSHVVIPEKWVLNLVILLLIPVLLLSKYPSRPNVATEYISVKNFPIDAADFLLRNPLVGHGRLVNPYAWGGYLIYRLYPKYLVSIDGRADLHKDHMVRQFEALQVFSTSWKKELDRLAPDVIIWPSDTPLADALRHEPKWRILYQDSQAVVFARK